MERATTEQNRIYAEQELRSLGIERIELVDGKPIFHYSKKLIIKIGGLEPADGSDFGMLGPTLELYFNSRIIFRSVPDQDIKNIINLGIDKIGLLPLAPGSVTQKDNNSIFASSSLRKASEYGYGYLKIDGEELVSDVIILLYDNKLMEQVPNSYQYKILEDPKEALLGVLLLHGSKNNS